MFLFIKTIFFFSSKKKVGMSYVWNYRSTLKSMWENLLKNKIHVLVDPPFPLCFVQTSLTPKRIRFSSPLGSYASSINMYTRQDMNPTYRKKKTLYVEVAFSFALIVLGNFFASSKMSTNNCVWYFNLIIPFSFLCYSIILLWSIQSISLEILSLCSEDLLVVQKSTRLVIHNILFIKDFAMFMFSIFH